MIFLPLSHLVFTTDAVLIGSVPVQVQVGASES